MISSPDIENIDIDAGRAASAAGVKEHGGRAQVVVTRWRVDE